MSPGVFVGAVDHDWSDYGYVVLVVIYYYFGNDCVVVVDKVCLNFDFLLQDVDNYLGLGNYRVIVGYNY